MPTYVVNMGWNKIPPLKLEHSKQEEIVILFYQML